MRLGQKKMKYMNGIYIEILPLDILPNDYLKRTSMLIKCLIYRKLTYAKAGAMCEPSFFHRVFSFFTNHPY